MYGNVGIFLSHAHEDAEFARRLGNDLIRKGLRVWIDKAELQVGDSLLLKIAEGLETMDYLAVIMSGASVRSEWVRREVEIAINEEIAGRRVKVLPVLLEDCSIPAFLAGKLYADFRNRDKYGEALEALTARFQTISPLQGLLRACLPAFTLHGVTLDEATLLALAKEKVSITSLERDLVVASIKALIVRHLEAVVAFDDSGQGGELTDTPPEIAALFESCAKCLLWADSCGARHEITNIYRKVEEAMPEWYWGGTTEGKRYLGELIDSYGAPPDVARVKGSN